MSRHDRMIHLGYGKYWRADRILGLLPIREDRGPGRRTEVFVEGRAEPVIASRTEETILEEVTAAAGGEGDAVELRFAVGELLADLRGLSPVLERMLRAEGGFDVRAWMARLARLTGARAGPGGDGQEDLFPDV